jgi:hypothetical protein
MKRLLSSFVFCGALLLSFPPVQAGQTLDKATVTFIQNDVDIADISVVEFEGSQPKRRPAKLQDTVTKTNAIVTGGKSRAEMKFNDESIVRLGQMTVFSFKEGSREITLEQGTALFGITKGQGRTEIKTKAITAAVTGTVLLVQVVGNTVNIFVYEGEVEVNGQKITQGVVFQFKDGKGKTFNFDITKALQDAALFNKFNGAPGQAELLAAIRAALIEAGLPADLPDSWKFPSDTDAILNEFIKEQQDQPEVDDFVPPPPPDPPKNNGGGYGGYGYSS